MEEKVIRWEGGDKGKKLGKKVSFLEETIESYSCSCTGKCNCYCACLCSPGVMYIFLENTNDATNTSGNKDYGEEQQSSNYSK